MQYAFLPVPQNAECFGDHSAVLCLCVCTLVLQLPPGKSCDRMHATLRAEGTACDRVQRDEDALQWNRTAQEANCHEAKYCCNYGMPGALDHQIASRLPIQ